MIRAGLEQCRGLVTNGSLHGGVTAGRERRGSGIAGCDRRGGPSLRATPLEDRSESLRAHQPSPSAIASSMCARSIRSALGSSTASVSAACRTSSRFRRTSEGLLE